MRGRWYEREEAFDGRSDMRSFLAKCSLTEMFGMSAYLWQRLDACGEFISSVDPALSLLWMCSLLER